MYDNVYIYIQLRARKREGRQRGTIGVGGKGTRREQARQIGR